MPPSALGEDEWHALIQQLAGNGPCVIGATGGSGTRVVARSVRRGGLFIGDDLNRSEDALDFAAFSDRWVNKVVGGSRPPELVDELRALAARQFRRRPANVSAWGWKEPRSLYLLPLLDAELPSLRFLHVVRDGRDMAYSENQMQLRKHGHAVLEDEQGHSEAIRSIALWNDVNVRAADYGERVLGERYRRVRFEDLCAHPVETIAEIFGHFRLDGDIERIAAEEIRSPGTSGRWRTRDAETVAQLEQRAGEGLAYFGYR
jgi:hypothetical protein